MGQILSWMEMKKKFPNEWVAIADPHGDLSLPYGEISGELLIHDKNEEAFTVRLKHIDIQNTPVDIRYTGDVLPDNPVGPILWQISNMNS